MTKFLSFIQFVLKDVPVQFQRSLKGETLVALDTESKQYNTVTELELNMDWAKTGLAQAPKASTSSPWQEALKQ